MKAQLKKFNFSKPQLLVFALVFGLLGIIAWHSFAANPNLQGDLNNDNTVNISDLSILLTNYGTTNTVADINSDGTVNITDLSILLSHYGSSYVAPANSYGYSAHILWQSDQANYVQLLVNGGAKTVRDDFAWSAIEPSLNNYNWTGPDSLVTQTANAGLSLLAMAGYGPGWATTCGGDKCGPSNNVYYADFVKQIALRYGTNGSFWSSHPSVPKRPLAGIEIWNEPNLGGFWLNPNPADYTSMLKAAYPAIKSADPNMMVISAGLAPSGGYNDGNCDGTNDGGVANGNMNGVNFLQQMYQNGAAGNMDAVGYHPYNWGGGTTASYFAYHLCSAWSQVNDTPVSVRSLMSQNSDIGKKVWATEIGGTTATGFFSESEQANLATQLVGKWKSYSWAGNFYWYDIRDDGSDAANVEHRFGTVRQDNSLKPAYNALKSSW